MNAQSNYQQPSTSNAQSSTASIISAPLSMIAPRLPIGVSSGGAFTTQSSNYSATNMYLPTTTANASSATMRGNYTITSPATTYMPMYGGGGSSVPPTHGASASTFDSDRPGDARNAYQANMVQGDSRRTLPQNKRRTAISRAVEYLEAVGESVTRIAPVYNYFYSFL